MGNWIYSAIEDKGKILFVPGGNSWLYEYDLDTFVVQRKMRVTDELAQYCSILKHGEEIYILPRQSKGLYLFNRRRNCWELYKQGDYLLDTRHICVHSGYIYILPTFIDNQIIKFDITRREYLKDDIDEVFARENYGRKITRFQQFDEDTIYFLLDDKFLCKWDLDKHKFTNIDLQISHQDINQSRIVDFAKMKQNIYYILENNNKRIYAIDANEDKRIIVGQGEGEYYKLQAIDECILIDAGNRVEILKEFRIQPQNISVHKKGAKSLFLSNIKVDNYWIIPPWGTDRFIIFSEEEELYTLPFGIDLSELKTNNLLREGDTMYLQDYLFSIINIHKFNL